MLILIRIHIHLPMHIKYAYACACAYICTHTHTHAHIHTLTHTHTHTHTHMHMHTHRHTCTNTHTYTHIHLHTYSHTLSHTSRNATMPATLSTLSHMHPRTHKHLNSPSGQQLFELLVDLLLGRHHAQLLLRQQQPACARMHIQRHRKCECVAVSRVASWSNAHTARGIGKLTAGTKLGQLVALERRRCIITYTSMPRTISILINHATKEITDQRHLVMHSTCNQMRAPIMRS